jgi:hypothetical protein
LHLPTSEGPPGKFVPFVAQFLAQFGPEELPLPRWTRPALKRGAVTVLPRVVVGPLVVSRKRFKVPMNALPTALRDASKRDAFLALNHWRLEQGIPERVFVIERVGEKIMKPQFIDFTSPHFAAIFTTIVMQCPNVDITLEEMLPAPDVAPLGADGRRWVVELQLDTLALRTPCAPYPTGAVETQAREASKE